MFTKTSLWIVLVAAVAMGSLPGCGRTQGEGQDTDGGVVIPDFAPFPDAPPDLVPRPDFAPVPDVWFPDFSRPDFGPPPDFGPFPDFPVPPDFGPQPDGPRPDFPVPPDFGPQPDFGPLPDGPQPPDFGPQPDFGPTPDLPPACNPTCANLCSVAAGTCGVLTPAACASQCPLWTPQQFACVGQQYCNQLLSGIPPNCSTVKTCIAQPTAVDLTVSKFSATVSGTTVTYTIETCNLGTAPSGNYFVDVYYNRTNPPATTNFGDQFNQVGSLAPKTCRTTVFTRTNTPPGTYTSWAQVDADGNVAESNETNNVGGPRSVTVQGQQPGPDLVIDSFTAEVTGTSFVSVRYRVRVCNKGTTTSPTSQVHAYYNRATAPATGQSGDKFTTVPSLAPGACSNRSIFRSGTPPGTYTSWAQVDPANTVAEGNETNNVAGPLKVTVGSSVGADLIIKTFTTQVFGTSSVRYRMEVCNIGTGTAGQSTVVVYFDRATAPAPGAIGDQLTTVPQLAPGGCSTRSVFRSGTPAGTYTSWAQIDVPDVVTETNETNNIKGPVKVTVGSVTLRPDLRINQMTAQVFGDKVNYSLVVCNFGQATAGPTSVDLYYNTSFPSSFTPGNHVMPLSTLVVGACQTLNHARQNTPAGTYSSWARVDRQRLVSESNEGNNTRGPVSVTVASTTTSCNTVCLTAVQCGLFSPVQFSECVTWCGKLSAPQKVCADKAVAINDCNALKTCAPVPSPPPPPPPGFCSGLCSWLQSPCNLVPSSQQATCLSLCNNLSPTQVQCAQTARQQNRCLDALNCVL